MPQTAMIKSLPAAFRMMKAMQAEGIEWGEDHRQGARDAVAALLRGRMDQLIDDHLERMAELGRVDRRNDPLAAHRARRPAARATPIPSMRKTEMATVAELEAHLEAIEGQPDSTVAHISCDAPPESGFAPRVLAEGSSHWPRTFFFAGVRSMAKTS